MKSTKFTPSFRRCLLAAIAFITILLGATACSAAPVPTPDAANTVNEKPTQNPFLAPASGTSEANDETSLDSDPTETELTGIVIDLAAETTPFNPLLLGTNVPAWITNSENETFSARTQASGVSMLRIPGGSWSNYYEWLPCEQDNVCPWDWGVMTPTDFINFISQTEIDAMYTINMNGTAQEAAALVAFFNGDIDDGTIIGVDTTGQDWGKVSDWANLRSDHGNPDPIHLTYWEIGNEVYAGKLGMGTECTFDWGWEDVWTCDGTEYVTGIGNGTERKDGFLDYMAAMKAVDPTILIGAVGINRQAEWNNWGNEVIAAAGDVMDFYIIHEYGYFDPPENDTAILALPQAVWEPMMADVRASFTESGNGRFPPIAITEYNLFSFQDSDNEQRMTRAVNMLYIADTIGQMATNGFAIANQWNLANGLAENGSDYGMLHADTYERYPQYYIFPLWAKFGTALLPVVSPYASDSTLSVYTGKREDSTISLLAINKTGEPITSDIHLLNGSKTFSLATVDTVQADSLDSQTVTFNGNNNPADDLANAPPTVFNPVEVPFSYTFAPYSVTLIQFVP